MTPNRPELYSVLALQGVLLMDLGRNTTMKQMPIGNPQTEITITAKGVKRQPDVAATGLIVVPRQKSQEPAPKASMLDRLAAFADRAMDFLTGDLELPALTEEEVPQQSPTAESRVLKFPAKGTTTRGSGS